jgi:osmotically-inducible protein OsmY
MITRKTVLSLIVAMFLTLACATTHRHTHDGTIENNVRQNISSAMAGHAYYANVSVNDGVVTLTGTTHSEEDRRTIGEAANRVKGVKTVINNITVDDNRT